MQTVSRHKDIISCLHCNFEKFIEVGKTTHGYDAFRCSDCNR